MTKQRSAFAVWLTLVLILAVVPFSLWLAAAPLAGRARSAASIWRSLGQLSGLVGMSLFAGNIILSARVKFLDRWFAGLNFVYRDHHYIGTVAFCLLLLHPLALAARFVSQSLLASAELLIPSFNNSPVLLGIISLLGIIFLLSLTYFFRPAYHRWFWSHKFLAAAFVFGYLHLFLVDSDVSAFWPLQLYFYLLGLATFLAIIYRVVLHRYLVPRFTYKIAAISRPSPDLFDITLRPVGKFLVGQGGQFAFFTFFHNGLRQEAHPFSIAGLGADGSLRLIAKALGDQTRKFRDLVPGDQVLVEGPYGRFGQNIAGRQLWVAGGIGITPFLSLASGLPANADVLLIQVVSQASQAVFSAELNSLTAALPAFRLIVWSTSESGRLAFTDIDKILPDWRERTILLCGPAVMMTFLREQFIAQGGESKKIISEDFSL